MKTIISSLVSLVILLMAAVGPVHAQIYKWVDAGGKTHYSDTAPMGAKKVETVLDKVSIYTPEPVRSVTTAESSQALSDKVDRLERLLHAERVARQQVELAALTQAPQAVYVPYALPVAVPVRHRRPDVFRPFPAPRVVNVVGPGIMPGTFNGPNAITAGNFTFR
jgi:uncharacterized protein DUF4124